MPPIKDKYMIHSTALVCLDADLKGAITVGPGTIIHPKAALFALGGPIIVGANAIIEEGAVLVNRRRGATMRVGDGTLVEVGARVEASEVGEECVFGARCRVGGGMRLGRGVVVGPGCLVLPEWERERLASAGAGAHAGAAGSGEGTGTGAGASSATTGPGSVVAPASLTLVDEETAGLDEIVPDYSVFYGYTPGRSALGCVGIGSGGVGVGIGDSTSSSPASFHASSAHHALSAPTSTTARSAVEAINALNAGPGFTTAQRRTWSGRGRVQEMDLRRKHAEYLREMLPKFNRQRKSEGQ